MNSVLLGPCNYYCGNCILYKRGKCLGCKDATEKASGEGKIFCDISICARGKKLATCADCKSYPCDKYDQSIFSAGFIKFLKDKLKES